MAEAVVGILYKDHDRLRKGAPLSCRDVARKARGGVTADATNRWLDKFARAHYLRLERDMAGERVERDGAGPAVRQRAHYWLATLPEDRPPIDVLLEGAGAWAGQRLRHRRGGGQGHPTARQAPSPGHRVETRDGAGRGKSHLERATDPEDGRPSARGGQGQGAHRGQGGARPVHHGGRGPGELVADGRPG